MPTRQKPPARHFYISIVFALSVFISFFLLDHICPFPESVISGDPWWKVNPLVVIVTVIDDNGFSPNQRRFSSSAGSIRNGTLRGETVGRVASKKSFNVTKRALENKKRYANLHGYELAVKSVKDWTRSTSWAKTTALLEAMDEFPSSYWLWFMDSMLIGHDCHGLNADSFLIRNSEWSRNFLRTIHNPEFFERFEEERIVMQMLIDYETIEADDKIHFVPFVKWSAEDQASLGKTLRNCVEHIRFHNMDAGEFRDKVAPFKEVLGTEYERISGYFSESFGKNTNAAAMIASWIDRKDLATNQETGGSGLNEDHSFQPYSASEIPYRFCLLVRGSSDGFSAKTFHSKCDGRRSTVTLFKLQDHDIFVGGYNPGVWDGNTSSLNTTNQGKIGRLISAESCEYALNCWRSNGPSFGNLDLLMHGRKLTFKHKTYMPNVMPFDDEIIVIEDYEVFEVVEKVKGGGKDAESIEK
ncbi:2151_t:CDS:2 [Acaulospora colombiana]|uniref:2151_t:CDS:1 n=1 Tax=Acaulospora colombiana TaxID=27376 RepID=A0ACA9MF31_9GLOM|nr:2151_t:CDS:2 [Acaulospora colombiana]